MVQMWMNHETDIAKKVSNTTEVTLDRRSRRVVVYNVRLRTVHRQLAADRFPPGTGPRLRCGRRVSLK